MLLAITVESQRWIVQWLAHRDYAATIFDLNFEFVTIAYRPNEEGRVFTQ